MKRGGPLSRKTPLRRRTMLPRPSEVMQRGALARGAGLKRKTRLQPMSSKRAAENEVRREVLEKLLEERGDACEIAIPAVCERRVHHGHEKLRRGQCGSIVDPTNILLTCWACHDVVHANPEWSYERGFLIRSGGG